MQTSSGAKLDAGRIIALGVALVAGVLLWDTPVLWPLKMLVVMMHETGHAIATGLVGGSVQKVTIAANESGQCLSIIPDGFIAKVMVYSSGYVGSAVAGGLMMLATFRFKLRRAVLMAACAWLTVMALVYAGDLFTVLFCLGTAVVLAAAAKFLPDGGVDLLNLFIAAFSALYVVFDLRDDLWDHHVRGMSDAALLANVTIVPAVIWAVLWTVFSLAILGAATWLSVQATRHRPLEEPYLRGRIR